MASIVWDRVGERKYESGLDRGVLYLPDGSAVPWNGLTSVIERFNRETEAVYYDGVKVNTLVTLGEFSATMSAVTYPDEFLELEGIAPLRRGVLLADQAPKTFGLCYRTKVGNDLDGPDAAYKIHILYNLVAIPSDKTYGSITDDPSLVEFEWTITAVPEEVEGFRPTAHIILDSSDFDPWLLADLEAILYGGTDAPAALLPMAELITFIREWYRVKIIDNENGTWTAVSDRPGFIQFMDADEEEFQIVHINAVYLDEVTFEISDTVDVTDVPRIQIVDNGDGTWTAKTDHNSLIVMVDETTFEIRDANVIYEGANVYRISDTVDD